MGKTNVDVVNNSDSLNVKTTNINMNNSSAENIIPEGFNSALGDTWIYPINYPLRDYQFKIAYEALMKNTLVCLPTGLGKTFIAAVVMYNIYRWYPQGKIIFMAPTKPLVRQQISACMKVFAIPSNQIVEITGSLHSSKRQILWETKCVFFVTPHTLQNDLKSGIFPVSLVRLLVIDEAHHTHGKYSYVEVVEQIREQHKFFRVLALTATPGKSIEDVLEIIKFLQINHLEIRSDDSPDVLPYIHSKDIQTFVISLDPVLKSLHEKYISIVDTYVRRLLNCGVLSGNVGTINKGRMVMEYKRYRNEMARGNKHPQHTQIMSDFAMCVTLYHGLDLLLNQGYRIFLNFFQDTSNKGWIYTENRLLDIRQDIEGRLEVLDLNDKEFLKTNKPIDYGHPKFQHLKDIISKHFEVQNSRCIVFCEYRDSVLLVHRLLLGIGDPIKPQMFTGVGSGSGHNDTSNHITKKQQMTIMDQFRSGACNVLVSTCIGEEGIDVGEVDLIICFDTSTKNPRRLVQRMGRTGRNKTGKVVLLVTEGREESVLKQCMSEKNFIYSRIENSVIIKSTLQSMDAPNIVPKNIELKCQQMRLDINPVLEKSPKKSEKSKRNSKKNVDIRNFFSKQNQNTDKTISTNSNLNKKRKLCDKDESISISKKQLLNFSSDDEFFISPDSKIIINDKEGNIEDEEKIEISSKFETTTKLSFIETEDDHMNDIFNKNNNSVMNKSNPFEYRCQGLPSGLASYITKVNLNDIQNVLNDDCEFCDKIFKCSSEHFQVLENERDLSFLNRTLTEPNMSLLKEACFLKINDYENIRNSDLEQCKEDLVDDITDDIKITDACFSKNTQHTNLSNNNLKQENDFSESDIVNDIKDIVSSQDSVYTDVLEYFFGNTIIEKNTKPNSDNLTSNEIDNKEVSDILSYFKLINISDIFEQTENKNQNKLVVSNNLKKRVSDEELVFENKEKTLIERNKTSPNMPVTELYSSNKKSNINEVTKPIRNMPKKAKLNISNLNNIKIPRKISQVSLDKSNYFEESFSPPKCELNRTELFDETFVNSSEKRYNNSNDKLNETNSDIESERQANYFEKSFNPPESKLNRTESFEEVFITSPEKKYNNSNDKLNKADSDTESENQADFRNTIKKLSTLNHAANFSKNFGIPATTSAKKKVRKRVRGGTTRKRDIMSFFDNEAAGSSSDDDIIEISDEDMSFVDKSFKEEDFDMTGIYLQSVRSPLKVNGFKMSKPSCSKHQVSYEDSEESIQDSDSNHEFDSFVVRDEQVEYINETSELEILEKKIRQKKKKRSYKK